MFIIFKTDVFEYQYVTSFGFNTEISINVGHRTYGCSFDHNIHTCQWNWWFYIFYNLSLDSPFPIVSEKIYPRLFSGILFYDQIVVFR